MRSQFRTFSNRRQARQGRSRFGRRVMMITGVRLRLLRPRRGSVSFLRRIERSTSHVHHVVYRTSTVAPSMASARATFIVAADAANGVPRRGEPPSSRASLGDHRRTTHSGADAAPALRRIEWTRSPVGSVLRREAAQPPTRTFGHGRQNAQISFGPSGPDRKVVRSARSIGRTSVAVEPASGIAVVEGSNRAHPITAAEITDIERLTDKVVAVLDRRLWSQRERMGGR